MTLKLLITLKNYLNQMSKYGNKFTKVDGISFHSKKEAARYCELKLEQRQGLIANLELQPKYVLQEGFTDHKGKKHRPITYTADFRYTEGHITVVEDVKGFLTSMYKLKKKLFLHKYPSIYFQEK